MTKEEEIANFRKEISEAFKDTGLGESKEEMLKDGFVAAFKDGIKAAERINASAK